MTLPEIKLTDPRALRGYAHPLRMALVGLLRVEGPLTATQAAERLNAVGENASVASCSFHLRQLAKYGLAERAEAADGREKPWQTTALSTSWDNVYDDPAAQAAANQLNSVILDHYFLRARRFLEQRAAEPPQWRELTGFGDALVHVTADEFAELIRAMDALLDAYGERAADPSTRPEGARAIGLIQLAIPLPDREDTPTPTPMPTPGETDGR